MRRRFLAILFVAVLALAGCGSDESGGAPNVDATLLLDFQPNAVHTGIYMAISRGYDTALGVKLHVRAPSESTDAVKLLASGRADLAILDIHDLALARERGRDLVGVMALVQTPLAAIFAQPTNHTPRDLEGKRVGVTGLPSDDAVLRSIVAGAGGDPDKVHVTTIGFNAVRSVLTGRVAGATGFWNAEGVALHARRPEIREFRVDDFGAPAYPELVLAVTRETLRDRASLVRASVAAIARGYEEVLSDPESGVSRARRGGQGPGSRGGPARARRGVAVVHRRRARLRRAQPPAPGGVGALGAALRDHEARAGRRPGVRRALRAEAGAGLIDAPQRPRSASSSSQQRLRRSRCSPRRPGRRPRATA